MIHKKTNWIMGTIGLNRVIWLLTFSDIFSWGLYLGVVGLIGLYLSKVLGRDTVEMVGIGFGVYYLVRGLSQIPIGIVVDRIKRDRDDLIVLIIGNILMGLPFLLYPFIQSEIAFYALQAIGGLGASMNLVNWRKMFAKNLDKGKEGTTYAVYDTVLSGAIALFSALIGIVSNIGKDYFDLVMIIIGILITFSFVWPAMIFYVKRKSSRLS